ncbi:N-acetyl-1-D-myo-inositol-2-amino-2-deoxy-alpha-D-glucopyranoside deacetylase [Mycobacterium sp. WMMD1722]|uniref:N-acetyl-1-D-myo-inositol-2-amino-2-deoxy-alpha- D-glucopyranoside deacetylase n=1 Tax=Mycobacterium sp. WMMD1722 TaxID=3404117 RepID=UPI003BF4D152
MRTRPRLLFVHAHPDDETLTTGGTIARYAAQGAEVRVVTCTLGEEGEVIGRRFAQLAVDHADQLGGYRISELTRALEALGAGEPHFLGGPGHWRDSGMAGTPPRRHRRFVDAPLPDAAGALAGVIDDFRPHVVVTYDPDGGYGHPDHIQTHRVTTAAVDAARWAVPRVCWTVSATSAIASGLRDLGELPPEWTRISVDEVPFGYPDDRIDVVIDVAASLAAKVAALRAHATQVSVAPDGRSLALSNNIAMPVLAEEHYIQVSGPPGSGDDLLAGLDLV